VTPETKIRLQEFLKQLAGIARTDLGANQLALQYADRKLSPATIVPRSSAVQRVVRVSQHAPVPEDGPDGGDQRHHAQRKADCTTDQDCRLAR
jgi:hypothetical protein